MLQTVANQTYNFLEGLRKLSQETGIVIHPDQCFIIAAVQEPVRENNQYTYTEDDYQIAEVAYNRAVQVYSVKKRIAE